MEVAGHVMFLKMKAFFEKKDHFGSNWIKLDQILKNHFGKACCLNSMFLKMKAFFEKKDHLGSNWIKLDQIRSNFEKVILKKTCS